MLELTEKDAENRREIGAIHGLPVRFFVITTDCETGDMLQCEVTEPETDGGYMLDHQWI